MAQLRLLRCLSLLQLHYLPMCHRSAYWWAATMVTLSSWRSTRNGRWLWAWPGRGWVTAIQAFWKDDLAVVAFHNYDSELVIYDLTKGDCLRRPSSAWGGDAESDGSWDFRRAIHAIHAPASGIKACSIYFDIMFIDVLRSVNNCSRPRVEDWYNMFDIIWFMELDVLCIEEVPRCLKLPRETL